MFYILDLSFLLLSAIEFLRNSAIQVKFIIINLLLFNDRGGGGDLSDFSGPEILAKVIFLMKDAGIF